jgi:hypothetical protein
MLRLLLLLGRSLGVENGDCEARSIDEGGVAARVGGRREGGLYLYVLLSRYPSIAETLHGYRTWKVDHGSDEAGLNILCITTKLTLLAPGAPLIITHLPFDSWRILCSIFTSAW